MSASFQRKLSQAHEHLTNGAAEAAAALCLEVLARAPRNPDALWLLGAARLVSGRADEAASLLERVVAVNPKHGAALEQLGVAHLIRGDHVAAEKALRAASGIAHAPPSVTMRLGLALLHQERHAEAIDALNRALALDPSMLDALSGLGRAHAAWADWDEAEQAFAAVLARTPRNTDALYNLGVVALQRGDALRACSYFERCLADAGDAVEARERLGIAYLSLGRFSQAAAELRRVVEAQPHNSEAVCALAEATFQTGAIEEALAFARRAQALDPSYSQPYALLGQINHVRGELGEAVDALEAGFAQTDADFLLGSLVHLTHRQCDWAKWSALWEAMSPRLERSANLGSPLWLLSEHTTAAQQFAYTKRWAAATYPAAGAVPAPNASRRDRERVRIGYYSGDFHQHPVPCLAVEVFELHDRSRFEVFAYSYGPDDGSAMRKRLEQAFEHFVDVAWDPNDVVEQRMREDDLDIIVEIKGYTAGDRLAVLAKRPCAIQVEWLGYPGPMASHFIDYVIADEIVIPADDEPNYSERVLRMPRCYQANDRKRASSEPLPRHAYGLPQEAFVFCCFNQTVKITPQIFGRWMSILRALPNAVLWLLEDNRWATENLKKSANAEDVDPSRVVIAPRLPVSEHLARYRVADVALDTFPYTSHTTGSDALWLGCPLVALRGETFASRVSASLLANCGLDDLITCSLEAYEQLALRLATEPSFLRDIRSRVAAACAAAPLFDSAAFTRDLESIYLGLVVTR